MWDITASADYNVYSQKEKRRKDMNCLISLLLRDGEPVQCKKKKTKKNLR